jgi:hypothetical protein
MVQAAMKYGLLDAKTPDVPPYSAATDNKFGNYPGPSQEYVNIAKNFFIKSGVRVRSLQQLRVGIANGYGAVQGSNVGFEMKPGRDGFHRRGPRWSHAMDISGFNVKKKINVIQNSWDDVHGRVQVGNIMLPAGSLCVHDDDMNEMINNGEVYLISNFQGFKKRIDDINKALFKLVN